MKQLGLSDITKEHWATLTVKQIASLYGLEDTSVRSYANRQNIPYVKATRKPAAPKAKRKPKGQPRELLDTQKILHAIPKEHWENHTVRELAELYKIHGSDIRSFAFNRKIAIKKVSVAADANGRSGRKKRSLLHTITSEDWSNLTAQELAEKYNLTTKNIRSFASRSDIAIKPLAVSDFDCGIITPAEWKSHTIKELLAKYQLDAKKEHALRSYAKRQGIIVRKSYKTDFFEDDPVVVQRMIDEINQSLDSLPQRIIAYRQEQGKTTVEMADFLNFNRLAYGKFEKGQKILSVNEIAMISTKTGLSLEFLIFGK